jgi:hypothetical protein
MVSARPAPTTHRTMFRRFESEFAPARLLQVTWKAILATFVGGRSERQTSTSYLESIIGLKRFLISTEVVGETVVLRRARTQSALLSAILFETRD